MNIKEKLLSLNIFKNNKYLDYYCDLILNNLNTKKEKYKTQLHHIIPRNYFKHYKLKLDNSTENLIYLKHQDHLLAHYYLVNCSNVDWFKALNIDALKKMIADIKFNLNNWKKEFINIPQFSYILNSYQTLITEANKYKSLRYKKYCWVNKNNETKWILKQELHNYLKNGWQKGTGKKISEEVKNKIRNSLKGTPHITSEETRKKISRANKGKKHPKTEQTKQKLKDYHKNKKLVCFNNGVRNKYFDILHDVIPEEYVKGMLLVNYTKQEYREIQRKAHSRVNHNTNGGTIVIVKDNKQKHIQPKELENYLNLGWQKRKRI